MEWLWSIVTAIVGWWVGHRESIEQRKRGIEEGAQAAFSIEIALVNYLPERDKQRLRDTFSNIDLRDTKQVHKVAQVAGRIYADVIRRDALHEAQAWQTQADQGVRSISYEQGYIQSMRDVLTGAREIAPEYLTRDSIASLEKVWTELETNDVSSSLDGKAIGRQLVRLAQIGKSGP